MTEPCKIVPDSVAMVAVARPGGTAADLATQLAGVPGDLILLGALGISGAILAFGPEGASIAEWAIAAAVIEELSPKECVALAI